MLGSFSTRSERRGRVEVTHIVLCNLAAVWLAKAGLYSIREMRLLYETPSIARSSTRDLKSQRNAIRQA